MLYTIELNNGKELLVENANDIDYKIIKKNILDEQKVFLEEDEYIRKNDTRIKAVKKCKNIMDYLNNLRLKRTKKKKEHDKKVVATELVKYDKIENDIEQSEWKEKIKSKYVNIQNQLIKAKNILIHNDSYKSEFCLGLELEDFVEDFKSEDIKSQDIILRRPLLSDFEGTDEDNEIVAIEETLRKLSYMKEEITNKFQDEEFIKDYVLNRYNSSIKNMSESVKLINDSMFELEDTLRDFLEAKYNLINIKKIKIGEMYISYRFKHVLPNIVIPTNINDNEYIDALDIDGIETGLTAKTSLIKYNSETLENLKKHSQYMYLKHAKESLSKNKSKKSKNMI